MSIVNFDIVADVITSSTPSENKDEVTVVTAVKMKDGRSFSIISEHKLKGHKTETSRRYIGLPSNIDVTVKTMALWEAPIVVTEVIKVYYGGEVAAITTTHVDK